MAIIVLQVIITLIVFALDAALPNESSMKKSLMPLLGATFIISMILFALMSW